MGKYWFMVLLFLGVTAIGCQGNHTGENSRAYGGRIRGTDRHIRKYVRLLSGRIPAF